MSIGVSDGIIIGQPPATGGGGSGTVTSVSATGTALVGVSINTPTTTPQIVLTVPTAPANTVWGNATGSVAGPNYTSAPQVNTLNANTVTATNFVGGLTGNAASASFANNLLNGDTGQLAYQSAANATTFVSGNTTTTPKVLVQTGNGTVAGVPTWTTPLGTGTPVFSASPTVTGTWTFSGAVSVAGNVTGPRWVPNGTAPTIAVGAAAGTGGSVGATILAGSCNAAGQLTIVTGAVVGVAGVVATITFAGTVSPAPRTSQISPANGPAATASTLCYSSIPGTTTWTINTDTPLALGATLVFFYQVI